MKETLVVFKFRMEFSWMRLIVSFCLSRRRERSSQNPLRLQIPDLVQIFSVLEGIRGGLISFPPTISKKSSSMSVLQNLDIQMIFYNQLLSFNSCYKIFMSDYEYQEEYQYEQEPQQEVQENIQTTVQLEYFEIQDLVRQGQGQLDRAVQELEKLYLTSEQHNLKTYKIKILNQLLQIYSKNNKVENLKTTLNRIIEFNKQQKYTQNSIKSIISILRATNYAQIRKDLLHFINQLDSSLKVKAYLYLLEKSIEEGDQKDSSALFELVNTELDNIQKPSASVTLQLYSLEVKFSKLTGIDISDKIHQIELRIPTLQTEAYMSEGHLSVLKLAIAETMFLSGNYENSALYIAQSFLEKAKYGNSAQFKQILKTNVLLSLLIDDPLLRKDSRYNSLYHDASIPFKNQNDVQSLISLVDSYEKLDIQQLETNYNNLNYKPQSDIYLNIYEKLLFNIKKQKLIKILYSYSSIKFSYIGRRLNLNEKEIQKMLYQLIIDSKIYGKIHSENVSEKYLEILPPRNEFLEVQADNLKQLAMRYLASL